LGFSLKPSSSLARFDLRLLNVLNYLYRKQPPIINNIWWLNTIPACAQL
jgi:hypothetical protein